MASTGTATGPQEADGTVQQPEAAAGVDGQHSGTQFRQEGASLSETGQAAGIKGSSSTAAELGLPGSKTAAVHTAVTAEFWYSGTNDF